ncbi:MAG: Phosphoribosylaminoimidazole-succinocarboxamide synthase [Fimbriimonadaceae bacterium]|nr:Phosphoribosylaminoimidazole-succinocarboxamide synthase [Fimbriimonadaceae bacterium]
MLDPALHHLGTPRRGKVRDVFDLGDSLLMVASDRISAFDVVMANGIPDKGKVLNQLSNFWFERLSSVCPNHLIETEDAAIAHRLGIDSPELKGRSVIVRKTEPLAIECVARRYIAGSLYKAYLAGETKALDLNLPDGMIDGSELPETIFTPATKAQTGHDENISFRHAADIVGMETAVAVRDWTLRLFTQASIHAASCGLILADTKFEFGITDDGLVWIDEALTPDSSRYWETSGYAPGKPQPSFDKQFVRDYLESIGWDKRPPGPTLPSEIVQRTREKYFEAFRRLTGKDVAV